MAGNFTSARAVAATLKQMNAEQSFEYLIERGSFLARFQRNSAASHHATRRMSTHARRFPRLNPAADVDTSSEMNDSTIDDRKCQK
jgi:hypothetical protein